METSPHTFYEKNCTSLKEVLKKLQQKARLLGLIRLITGLLILLCLIYVFKSGLSVWWIGMGVSTVLFIILVRASADLTGRISEKEVLLRINENELKAIKGDFSGFDGGNDLLDGDHPYAFDLDLFGDKSLFQRINRTVSLQGRRRLALTLSNPGLDAATITARQTAIEELENLPEWRQLFLTTGTLLAENPNDKTSIENWLKLPPVLSTGSIWPKLLWLLPAITVLSWILFIIGVSGFPVGIPISMSLLLLAITGNKVRFVNERHQLISKRSETLKKYYELVELITHENFQAGSLKDLQRKLDSSTVPSGSFQHLIKLINALDNRLNLLMAIILNGLVLWDLNCLMRIEKSALYFKDLFEHWIESIAQTDALISLSGYNYNHTDYVTATILDSATHGGFYLEMVDGGHPLLYPDPCITNSLLQDQQLNLFLITGANMAGKSTFLRTVALNMILAMAGCKVCARKYTLTPVAIYTSMRTNDSLQKHTSFFFAELKRLQWIVEKIKARENVYILLDEILKGTNSKDQHLGSAELIKNIIAHQGRGLIATHDIELTTLANDYNGQIKNIAFEIEMDGDKMVFSYQYKEGVCQNMNASILMKQMGII